MHEILIEIKSSSVCGKAGLSVLLSFFLLFSAISVAAQNLVSNPGFEEYAVCPGNYTQHPAEFRVKCWASGSSGTPDHFHRCSNGDADVPHNWAGVSEAYEGGGYAGIYVWTDQLNYREYLQSELSQTLVKDSTYSVAFHFRLSSYSMYAVDRIGLHFLDSLRKPKTDKVLRDEPEISLIQDSALTLSTGLWEVVKQEYKARGSEKYIVIGNFYDDTATHSYKLQFNPVQQLMLRSSAYYYIDNVEVKPKYSPQEEVIATLIPAFDGKNIEADKAYVLKNINFEFDSYKLSYASAESLDELVSWLRENASFVIQLSGHTDDQGSDKYNLALSTNRARTAAQYLIAKGIPRERVTYNGFGKRKPLINGTSEEARGVNRRVEVKFFD